GCYNVTLPDSVITFRPDLECYRSSSVSAREILFFFGGEDGSAALGLFGALFWGIARGDQA
ncbi:hypothetical protein Godav_025043, partial [Gossypium davidsonii]|nr:hypothetical protein [Gossypium davidsonii]